MNSNNYLFYFSTYAIGTLLLNIGYKKFTVRKKNIRIRHKLDNFKNPLLLPYYNNISKFALIDYNYYTYTIPNTYFNKIVNPYKLYNKMDCFKEYNIKYYGFYIPIIGLYPRIIEVNIPNHVYNINSFLVNKQVLS